MGVEEAIASAKTFFQRVFADEMVSAIRLEEIEFDEAEKSWLVTLSAMQPSSSADRWATLAETSGLQRTFRTVKIDDAGERLPSVKIRQMHGEA